ncbi:hypothetical protein G6F57_007338 [Rhizopus arrhizus]|uniref:Uncharacterized protein n=1 Tax=Rhizopus oryzae TaxID=64495 RepID=A0A9P6X2X7_RHIOR|nr:hypothetical protein G6F23_011514 [Rhizopus arrhizus]KAG1416055.1 hypothetical protein G6F58_006167 [Rhizopus delemar]KAG0758822.1 hypothetical protein G6F24_009519 [Rhizopus arrhizus]KAG0777548.1 hypothetical protein G6F22_011797 [Rhizopus arrhizus]KAG0788629.1 hypothetical protein G6F21_007084 [Rhizopus arrhizus]
MPITETFHGFIETTTDTLLVFEACRQGILPKINRRLQERERGAVKSGTVFVFDEKESGIKRWTDGLVWSPSRILGNFLIYRELDGRELLDDKQPNRPYIDEEHKTSDQERALVGSLTDTYKFKLGGLIKKTLSIQVNGSSQHLISYYTKEDVLDGKLSTPSSIPELSSIRISPDLFMQQNFRIPLSLEYPESCGKRLSTGDSRRKSSALLLEMAHPYMDIPYYSRRRLSSGDLDASFKKSSRSYHDNKDMKHRNSKASSVQFVYKDSSSPVSVTSPIFQCSPPVYQQETNYILPSTHITFPASPAPSHKDNTSYAQPSSWFKYAQKEPVCYYDNKRIASPTRQESNARFTSFDNMPLENNFYSKQCDGNNPF